MPHPKTGKESVVGGLPAPTFCNFVLAHDILRPNEAAMVLNDVRHEDGSIVGIGKISEVVLSNSGAHTWCQVIQYPIDSDEEQRWS